jgi:hypothetical protein
MKEPVTEMIRLRQDADCGIDESQEIEIEIIDNGGGSYAVIKTERWAVDSGMDLKRLADKIDELIRQYDLNGPFAEDKA